MEIKKKQILLSTALMLISLLAATYIIYILAAADAYGKYLDPTTKVNANEQTDLFDKSINDWSELQSQIQNQKESIVSGIKSEQGLDALAKENKSQIQSGADSLSSILATDLNSRGQEEMLKDNVLNNLYVDFSKSLNKQHMIDAKKIAKGQDKLLANLLPKLRELGVDCRAVQGPKEIEPAYYLQIETTKHKDTIYNKKLCEELSNQYDCTDSVSLTCKRIGKRYGEWQERKINFNGYVLHNQKVNWGYAAKWKKKRWGWHITPYHPKGWGEYQIDSIWRNNPAAIIADARAYIALQLGVFIEQIGEHVVFPASGRGIGNITPVYCRWRVVWDEYEFSYSYRDAYDICEEWKEDWTERCNITHTTRTVPPSNKKGQR